MLGTLMMAEATKAAKRKNINFIPKKFLLKKSVILSLPAAGSLVSEYQYII
jgi:hypothetical protein